MSSRTNSHLVIVDSGNLHAHDGPGQRHEHCLSKVSRTSSRIYKPYKYRFVITALFCLSSIVNAIMWISTSPITTNLENIYQLDEFRVNFCTSLIWFVTYPPVNFIANYILDEKGLRVGVFVGTALTVIGLWIRVLSEHSFYYIFAGQLIGSIGQPFLLNAPQKLSAVWYPPKDQALSTTIVSVANPVGVGIGFIMAQNFVDDDASGLNGLSQVNNLMFFSAIMGSIVMLPTFLFFRSKPPTPPSRVAETDKYDYKESLKHLLANKNYLLFIVSSGLIYGGFNVLATALQPLILPYGFSESQSGDLGAITLISGLIGSFAWGIYLDRKQRYKFCAVCCGVTSIVCLVLLAIASHFESFLLLAGATTLYGFFTTPLLPIAFEFSAQLSFPVAEAASGGLMVVMIQIMGAVGTLGIDALLEDGSVGHSNISLGIVVAISILGLIGFIFTKEDLRRIKVESELIPGEMIESTGEGQLNKIQTSGFENSNSGIKSSLLAKP